MNIIKAREELLLGKNIYDMNLKVVDYGRVSTDKDEQVNSLENQINYFNDYIKSVNKWEHVNSYIDEGISGTQVKKREQFLKMIEDAKEGKFDLILTKEVSRFARNTIDSIKYTEMLLNYGVAVFFITDNINTIYKDSEFRLTIMASMAQDEVRKLSERVKFGIKRSIKDGKVGGGGIYGYNKNNSKLTINEEEAKVIKMVFTMYASRQYGLKRIGEILASKKIFTRKGNVFSDMTLKKIIKNPRYKGWYTANLSEIKDYKTHKRVYKEEKEWILYKDKKGNVPKIVSERLWNEANLVLKERNKKRINNNLMNNKYTSKIICLEHNKSFIRTSSGKRINNPVWHCNQYLRFGVNGCLSPRLYEKNLDEIFYNVIKDIFNFDDSIINEMVNDYKKIMEVNNKNNYYFLELEKKELQKEKLLDFLLRNIISEKEYLNKYNKILLDIENIKHNYLNNICDNNLKNIKEKLIELLDIKNNLGKYFNIFINKVFVSKNNNNRNEINLKIVFNYIKDDLNIKVSLN